MAPRDLSNVHTNRIKELKLGDNYSGRNKVSAQLLVL